MYKRNQLNHMSRRDFLKVAGALTTVSLAASCKPYTLQNTNNVSALPAYDYAPVPESLTSPSAYKEVTSGLNYQDLFFSQINDTSNPNYFGADVPDQRFYLNWLSSQEVRQTTSVILKDFIQGNPTNDLANPSKWIQFSRAGTENSSIEHLQILTRMGAEGVDSSIQIKGYFPDIKQPLRSNILRQLFIVQDTTTGKSYTVKILPVDEALQEMGSLSQIQQEMPAVRTPQSTTFKLATSPRAKLTITISDAILDSSGRPAPTLAQLIESGTVTNQQKLQLLDMYRSYIRVVADPNKPIKIGADVFKPGNLVIDPSDSQLVAVDAFSSNSPTFATLRGYIKTGNSSLNQHIFEVRKTLMELGIDKPILEQVDLEVSQALQAQGSLATEVEAGASIPVTILGDDGQPVTTVNIVNDIPDQKPVIIPPTMPLWASITMWGSAVLAGIGVGLEVAQKVISADDLYEATRPMSTLSDTRGLTLEQYSHINDGQVKNTPFSYGHSTYTFDAADMKTMQERHDWNRMLRAGLNLPEGSPSLKVRLQHDLQGSTPSIELAYSRTLDTYGQPILSFEAKAPKIYKDQNGDLQLDIIPIEGNTTVTDVSMLSATQVDEFNANAAAQASQFDQLDAMLQTELEYLPRGEKWTILNTLENYVTNGYLDFFTTSEDGRIVYGVQSGNTIKMRYLAYESQEGEMYKGTDGKLHYFKKALTLNELVTL